MSCPRPEQKRGFNLPPDVACRRRACSFNRRSGARGNRGRIAPGGGSAASIVAPEFIGYAIDTNTVGAARTPDLTPFTLLAGDILIMRAQNRGAGSAATLSLPAGQGWSTIAPLTQSVVGISEAAAWKRWGSGDTDDTTPTFTWSTGGSVNSAAIIILRKCKATGTPYTITPVMVNHAANLTLTTPVVATAPEAESLTIWGFQAVDDNTLNALSRGSQIFSNNLSTFAAMAMAYEIGVDASTAQATMTESTNGPDAARVSTLVIDGGPAADPPFDFTQFSSLAYVRSRINDTGWRSGVHTDPIPRGGFVYRYAACVELGDKIRFTCWRRPEASSTWTLVSTYLTAAIPDPPSVSNWPADAHFTITIGTSKSGLPQLWFLGHAAESAMQFWQGAAIGDTTCSAFTTWTDPVEGSYPQQMNLADGTSLFSCRIGTPGNDAQQCLYEQDADELGWTVVTSAIMNFTDGTGDDESPYMQRLQIDPATDRLKVSWCWAKQNITNQYHDVMYVEGRRTGVATWTWHDVAGGAVTLPVLDTTLACQVATTAVPLNCGLVVHSGMSFDPATGRPLIAIVKAKPGNVVGTGSEHYLFEWSGSGTGAAAWNQRDVGEAHPTWNYVDAPPEPEYAQARSPDVFVRNGVTYYTWTSNANLSTSGLPCLYYRTSTDRITWSAAARLVDLPWGDGVGRYDAVGLHVFNTLTYYQQLVDSAANFGNPASAAACVVDIP